jgi:tRNA pseudouridine32 synthase/23S rRNA pseudouridine746 synthase
VEKRYEALVDGVPAEPEGQITLPIARDWENRPRQKICAQTGKQASTRYRVLESADGCSRLLLSPLTGRTHQLRIHCRAIGHPILGCDLYAPNAVLGRAPRLMLHASYLAFPHPSTGRLIAGHSPAPF